MNPTLLILAAGMGSRYGGLKQLDQVGPNKETIMDYSVNDAIAAGFDRVVFVIRRDMEEDFKTYVLSKYVDKIKVDYVFQELSALPAGLTPNPERVKPYGTGHAILMAKEIITTPFAVINADDYYGADAFITQARFLKEPQTDTLPHFAMVGYQLNNTLSENGTVSRGVCSTNEDNFLTDIVEMLKIKRHAEGIKNTFEDGNTVTLAEETPVSMNFWGFTPVIFQHLEEQFIHFFNENQDNLKAEFQIPTLVGVLQHRDIAKVRVLKSTAQWFGITYQEDRAYVVEKLLQLKGEN